MQKKRRIAMLLYTQGVAYDDRVRKEILTVHRLYQDIDFHIFAITPENKYETGITHYGIPYTTLFLESRSKYKSGHNTILKAWDFYRTVTPYINDYDAIWCADTEPLFCLLFSKHKIIWDLHEIPSVFLRNIVFKRIFQYLEGKCKVIVHANPQRLSYLTDNHLIKSPGKHLYLRNYPQFDDNVHQQLTYAPLNDFLSWKGKSQCVYLQGLNESSRAPYESISALMRIDSIKGVVIGRFDESAKRKLLEDYGDRLYDKIYFTGMLPQQYTPLFMKECFTSIVLYINTCPNNYYCEANRLYQNIVSGNPVVVGNNPPMKDLVEKHGLGVVLKTDGTDIEAITVGILDVMQNSESYCSNIEKYRIQLNWNSQDQTHHEIINKLFK